jgi:hypothetical protein
MLVSCITTKIARHKGATPNRVMYAKAFFDLQLQFAHSVTVLSGLPLSRARLEHGEVKESMTREFLARLERQSSVDGLGQCVPFQVPSVEASVLEFYHFYGLSSPCRGVRTAMRLPWRAGT